MTTISSVTLFDGHYYNLASALQPLDGESFWLSVVQKQKISCIIMQYIHAPFTQNNFNKIQEDLKNQGLSPDQLAVEDHVQAFDPIEAAEILPGSPMEPLTIGNHFGTAQRRADNYMRYIANEWKFRCSKRMYHAITTQASFQAA